MEARRQRRIVFLSRPIASVSILITESIFGAAVSSFRLDSLTIGVFFAQTF